MKNEIGPRFRTDADPVNVRRGKPGSVRLDGDLEAGLVERLDKALIHLKQRFAPRADHERPGQVGVGGRPVVRHGSRQRSGGREAPSSRSITADKVRIAEPADGAGAVLFPAGPEIAAGKPTENGGPARVGSLALQGVEDLLDGKGHKRTDGPM